MATNLAIDDALLEQAREISGLATKKAVVTQALQEYVHQVTTLFGTVEYDKDYDYKALRKQGAAVKGKRGRAGSR
jgi:Arc/MetJ family transcription regulator